MGAKLTFHRKFSLCATSFLLSFKYKMRFVYDVYQVYLSVSVCLYQSARLLFPVCRTAFQCIFLSIRLNMIMLISLSFCLILGL